METTNLAYGDPVSTAAWSLLHLCPHQADPDTAICSYFLTKGALPKSVASVHIISSFASMPQISSYNAWGSTLMRLAPTHFDREAT